MTALDPVADTAWLRALSVRGLWAEAQQRMLNLEQREGGICDHTVYFADAPFRRAIDELHRREWLAATVREAILGG